MRYLLIGLLSLFIGNETLANRCQQQCPSWWAYGWGVTIFSGPLTSQTTSKIVSDPGFSGSGIIGLAVSKKLGPLWNSPLDIELETQLVQHFGGQTHFEFNPIALVARWTCFPWNSYLPTTIAIGDGISIASEIPKLEIKRRGLKNSSQTLNYVMAEITLALPEYPHWALVARYHHRSGAFGIFNGVHDASTAFAAGLKYWF